MSTPRRASCPILFALLLAASAATAPAQDRAASAGQAGQAGRTAKAAIPLVQPEAKREAAPSAASGAASGQASDASGLFEEIEFGGTLVIEGKVEKPQVQFTLLKEPPPEKEIRFEASFLESILKHERENTFRP